MYPFARCQQLSCLEGLFYKMKTIGAASSQIVRVGEKFNGYTLKSGHPCAVLSGYRAASRDRIGYRANRKRQDDHFIRSD